MAMMPKTPPVKPKLALVFSSMGFIGLILFAMNQPPPNRSEGLAMHIHVRLSISIEGRNFAVPSDIGISRELWIDHSLDDFNPEGMSPLHTHDSSGTIHVESTVVRNYTLGEFFDVWGVRFDDRCISDYCSNEGYALRAYVNGNRIPDPRDYVLSDGDELLVELGSK